MVIDGAVDRANVAATLRERGLTLAAIAERLVVSRSTVIRLLDPEAAERHRAKSREAKRRRTGVCVDCGGTTRYSGQAGKSTAVRCRACQDYAQTEARIWTADVVTTAIRRFAADNGRPPHAREWVRANPELGYPAIQSVYRTTSESTSPFRSWNAAIAAAGFEPLPPGTRVRAVERRAETGTLLQDAGPRSVKTDGRSSQTTRA
jgi:predicted transcriptional regulator